MRADWYYSLATGNTFANHNSSMLDVCCCCHAASGREAHGGLALLLVQTVVTYCNAVLWCMLALNRFWFTNLQGQQTAITMLPHQPDHQVLLGYLLARVYDIIAILSMT